MAATKRNAMLIEEARRKIRTTQLINRLQNHALGKVDMTKSQVTATGILLRKSLPDLVSTELTGRGGGPIETRDMSLFELARRIVASRAEEGAA